MLEIIKQNVLYPLAGRLGTIVAGPLITLGATQQHVDWLLIGITGLAGVCFDLTASWVRRRSIIDRTFNEVVGWVSGGQGK